MRRALLAALLATGCGAAAKPESPPVATGASASVERRDLVDRDSLDGTLGYADTGSLAAAASGVLTAIRAAGDVVGRGHSLYDVDDKPAAFVMYGALPAWRDFTPGMSRGDDVRQLERNLRALGYDTGDDDGRWTYRTTDAVEDFQSDRGLTRTGSLTRATIVFRSGATRIGASRASVGDAVSPGRPLADVSSTRQEVTVPVPADRQRLAHVGERVAVDMPTGRTVHGRVSDVGKVATKHGDDASVPVTVALPTRGTGFDQAPVTVGFEVDARSNVLAVPVKALLARQGGGYAVETPDHRMLRVTPGLFADDWVQVSGAGLEPGMRVVTAQ